MISTFRSAFRFFFFCDLQWHKLHVPRFTSCTYACIDHCASTIRGLTACTINDICLYSEEADRKRQYCYIRDRQNRDRFISLGLGMTTIACHGHDGLEYNEDTYFSFFLSPVSDKRYVSGMDALSRKALFQTRF